MPDGGAGLVFVIDVLGSLLAAKEAEILELKRDLQGLRAEGARPEGQNGEAEEIDAVAKGPRKSARRQSPAIPARKRR